MTEVFQATEAAADAPSVIRLENVQWAGPLVSSSDPSWIAGPVRQNLAWDLDVRVEAVPGSRTPETLPGLPTVPPLPVEKVRRILTAAAAVEARDGAPLSVWLCMAKALAGEVTLADVRAVAQAWSDTLILEGDDGVSGSVRFSNDGLQEAARRAFPPSMDDQQAIVQALLSLWFESPSHTGPIHRYITLALPVHAALAGSIEPLLEDPAFLARAHWYSLWQALALAYPDGVPTGGTASDIHYLHAQGVQPNSQGEWVAWLHHAAVSRGRDEFADALLAKAEPLPWQTLWSHWRLPGPHDGDRRGASCPDALRAVSHNGQWAVTAWHELREPGPRGHVFDVYLRDARSGELLEGPRPVEGAWPATSIGQPFPGVTYAVHREGWRSAYSSAAPPLPRVPDSVMEAVRLGEAPEGHSLWVFAGIGGLFAAAVDDEAVAELPADPWPSRFAWGPVTRSAPWPLPWPLPLVEGGLSRAWLERDEAFGAAACRPVAEDRIPAAVEHSPTRRFLSEVGWPVTRGIAGLYSSDLTVDGLAPVEGGSPLLSGLGRIGSVPLLLDGRTGKAFTAAGDGSTGDLAASSLQHLLVLLLLKHTALTHVLTAGDAETDDLAESLVDWYRKVDPVAADSPVWKHDVEDFPYLADDYQIVLEEITRAARAEEPRM